MTLKRENKMLIKSILLAFSTYVMSTFLLLLEICENLASVIAKFWWSSNPPKRRIHWTKWEKVCLPRKEGRISFRMIHEFQFGFIDKTIMETTSIPQLFDDPGFKGKIL